MYFELKVSPLSWQIVQRSLPSLAGGDFEFISFFLNLQQNCGSCEAAAELLSVLHKGCRSVRLLQRSQRVQIHCCCLLTTNWVTETKRDGEREEDTVRLAVRNRAVYCGAYLDFIKVILTLSMLSIMFKMNRFVYLYLWHKSMT